ncbi:unnamed protein product [Closterium sp. NIES-65]|nr:unnamed protein product [Closterium sp. NIES-65]
MARTLPLLPVLLLLALSSLLSVSCRPSPLATSNASRKPGGGSRGGKSGGKSGGSRGGKSGGSKKGASALSCPSPWPELDSCPTSESLPQLEDSQTEFPGAVWGALRPHKVPGVRNSPADATWLNKDERDTAVYIEECCSLCALNDQCEYWTFTRRLDSIKGTCQLFSSQQCAPSKAYSALSVPASSLFLSSPASSAPPARRTPRSPAPPPPCYSCSHTFLSPAPLSPPSPPSPPTLPPPPGTCQLFSSQQCAPSKAYSALSRPASAPASSPRTHHPVSSPKVSFSFRKAPKDAALPTPGSSDGTGGNGGAGGGTGAGTAGGGPDDPLAGTGGSGGDSSSGGNSGTGTSAITQLYSDTSAPATSAAANVARGRLRVRRGRQMTATTGHGNTIPRRGIMTEGCARWLCTLFHSQACRFMTEDGFLSPPVFDPAQTNTFMFPLPCYSAV